MPTPPFAGTRKRSARRSCGTSAASPACEIAGAPLFLHEVNPANPAETSPDRAGVTSVRIEVFVDDPDGFVARAVGAGATPRSPVVDHEVPWGTHRQGGFRDPFGHAWSVGDRSPLREGA